MISFEVTVNNEPPVVAADEAISVLSAIATYVPSRSELDLSVSGLVSHSELDQENLMWLERALRPGDCVTIRVIEVAQASEPVSRVRSDPDIVDRERRRYYRKLKQEYEGGRAAK